MRTTNAALALLLLAVSAGSIAAEGYYRSPSGRVVTQWPFAMSEFERMTEKVDPNDYEVGRIEG